MKYHLEAAVILLAALVCVTAPAFAQDNGPKSAALKIPAFGAGLTLGITSALTTVEGSGLLADGGGLEIGGLAGFYPLLFGEAGVEAMRFDLTAESDKAANQRVRVEMFGYYAGGGVGLPLDGGAIGFRYRIQRKSLVKLQIENRDTEETDVFRDRVTRRSYFIFLALGGKEGKGRNPGNWLELGLRYDDVDKNIFLISDVLGAYARALFQF